MAEIVARFADGRLLVQEDKVADTDAYTSGEGLRVRVGLVRVVEKVLSVDAHISGYPGEAGKVETPLREVTTSGDTVHVVMRRADAPQLLSGFLSGGGIASYGVLSGVTSGRGLLGELCSGVLISGQMKILLNVIGH